jgi:hypothetical protein
MVFAAALTSTACSIASVALRRRSRFPRVNRTTDAKLEPGKECIGADWPSDAFCNRRRREGFRLGAGYDELSEAADAIE